MKNTKRMSWPLSARRSSQAALVLGALVVVPVIGSHAVEAQVKHYKEIEYPELAEFVIPTPEIYELSNGLRVFMLEDPELPLITLSARIRVGAVEDPANKIGLASLMGQVQRSGGSTTMPADEMDDFLEARAASVETSVGANVGFASMDCLTDDFDEVFQVFSDVLRSPAFPEDRIEIAKSQITAGIARRNDDVGAITGREFRRLVYGPESPLSALQEYATISSIERDDLVALHARHYSPNNVLLGVTGDFDSEAMKRKIEAVLGDWQPGAAVGSFDVAYNEDHKGGVYLIEKADVTQANVRLGHLGITYDNPDYFAVQVMNEVLGGGFSSRMFSKVRTEKGLAYSAFGRVSAGFSTPGLMQAGVQTKSETMAEAVDAVFEELRGMTERPATAEELSRAKDTLLNSFVFNYASAGQVLGQQMLYSYHGLPLDFLERYRSNIEKVTETDVLRVAEKYLDPDNVTLLVVGNPADFDRPASDFGAVKELDISIPPPPSTAPALEVNEESLAAGDALLVEMAEAIGGANRLQAKSIRLESKLLLSLSGQQLPMSQTSVLVYPDRFYNSMRIPMGTQETVMDGPTGFIRAAGRTQDMPADQYELRVNDRLRDLHELVRLLGSKGVQAVAAGEETAEGNRYRILSVARGDAQTRLWLDDNGRVRWQKYQSVHPFTQAPGEFEVSYSDYREIDGGWSLPFAESVTIDGEVFAEVTHESIEIDPEVDLTIFEKPAE